MDQILSRPEIQSAVVPFIVGFLLYIGLRKLTVNAWIWAVFAAFLISASLINGLTLTPLTGTRKIILLIVFSCVIAGSVQYFVAHLTARRVLMYAFGVIALIWVFRAVTLRMEMPAMALFIAGPLTLVLWLIWAFERIGDDDARLHGAGFSLLLGTGLCAAAGSSALLGQLALSFSVASGSVLLGWVILGRAASSSQNSVAGSPLPYAMASALLGLASVIFARVPVVLPLRRWH